MAEFFRPDTLQAALELLARYQEKAAVVNGGSDIVIDISQKRITPCAIVSIGQLTELRYVREDKEWIRLGGAIPYREMAREPICQKIEGLITAISNLGSPGVRAVGTPAGNIGTAAPAADCATMLMALGAVVVLVSTQGERTVPLQDFYLGRNRTVKRPDELIYEICFPAIQPGEGTGYCKVARRKAQDIGKILVGARIQLAGDVIRRAAISLGALNANIVRACSLEEAVTGMKSAEAQQYLKETFPKEAVLRESYFKEYKELTTRAVVAQAFSQALASAERRK